LIVTLDPAEPAVGEKLVMVGWLPVVKMLVLTVEPALVVTVTGPVYRAGGNRCRESVEAVTVAVNGVVVPLNVTVVPPTIKISPAHVNRPLRPSPLDGEKTI